MVDRNVQRRLTRPGGWCIQPRRLSSILTEGFNKIAQLLVTSYTVNVARSFEI